MFLRTTKRRNADGSEVRYLQLAQSEWDPLRGCSIARILYNFGRVDRVSAQHMRGLARSILRTFSEEQELAPAQDMTILGVWPYGGIYVLGHIWDELGLGRLPALQSAPLTERALFALCAHRALTPFSEISSCQEWLSKDVFAPFAAELRPEHFAAALDLLAQRRTEVEAALFHKIAGLLHAQTDLVFFHKTSLPLDAPPGALPAPYAPPVLCLAVSRNGLPLRSWVFDGRLDDATTTARIQDDLRAWDLSRCVEIGAAATEMAEAGPPLTEQVRESVLTASGRYRLFCHSLPVGALRLDRELSRRRYIIWLDPDVGTGPGRRGLGAEAAVIAGPAGSVGRQARWLARSNDPTLNSADLAQGCKRLVAIQQCWQKLREDLHLMSGPPAVAHIQAHAGISLLALLLERMVEIRARQPWLHVAAALSTIQVVEYQHGKARFYQTTAPRHEAREALKALLIGLPPRIHAAPGPATPADL